MKKFLIGSIILGSLIVGGEAFPRQLSAVNQISALSGRKHVKAAPQRLGVADIISEAPEGVHKSYYRDGSRFQFDFNYDTFEITCNVVGDQYVIGDVVEGDDGFFYFKNPVMGYATDTYMKGEREGDEIVFKLPQAIFDDEDAVLGVSKMRLMDGGFIGIDAEIVKDNNEVCYKINSDGTYTQIEEEGYILGYYYMDDDSWTWMGTPGQTYYPFDDVATTAPEGAEINECQMIYDGNNGLKVKTAVVGDEFYLGNLYSGLEDSWVVGKIADGKVTFDSYQYLGASEANNHYAFFVGASIEECENDVPSNGYASISFNYDAAEGKLSPVSSEDAIVINASGKEIYYLDYYGNPTVSPFILQPATPLNPQIISYDEMWDYYGYAILEFRLPVVSTEGNLLDKDYYFYNIIIDDEPMEFYPDEYPTLTEVITDIPYNFSDPIEGGIATSDMYVMTGTHTVVIYDGGYDTIGVQGIYTVDGVTNYTDIVYYSTVGVKEVADQNREVNAVEFYDLTGRRISNPSNGIFIKKTTFTDGTSKVAKISVK